MIIDVANPRPRTLTLDYVGLKLVSNCTIFPKKRKLNKYGKIDNMGSSRNKSNVFMVPYF